MLLYGTSADELLMPCILISLSKPILLSRTFRAEEILCHLGVHSPVKLCAFRLQTLSKLNIEFDKSGELRLPKKSGLSAVILAATLTFGYGPMRANLRPAFSPLWGV